MKYIYAILILMCSTSLRAQNCNPQYTTGLPNTVNFTNPSSFPGPGYYFHWDFGDGSSIIASNPVHIYNLAGNYVATVTVHDSSTGNIICSGTISLFLNFCITGFQQDPVNPATFTFNASVFQTVANWDFGDGQTASGSSVIHTYAGPGVYTVTMTQTDSSGAITICTTDFMVAYDLLNSCSISSSQPNPVGSPNVFEFNALVPSSSGTVTWDFGDGSPSVTGLNVQHGYGAPGIYNVCISYINGNDSCTYCLQVNVTMNPNSCSFTAIPGSNPMYFDFIATGNPGSTFTWDFGDGATGAGAVVNHTYATTGTYLVCMQEIDSSGVPVCNFCSVITVSNPPPACVFSLTAIPGNPFGYVLSAPSGTGYSYHWDFGDGTVDTSGNPVVTHVFSAAGNYNVCLGAFQNGVQICSYCIPVYISGNPSCQAAFTSVSVGLIAYFIDQSVAISPTVPPVPPPVYYNWDFGDGNTSTLQFPQHQYSLPGTYTVCLNVTTPGCTTNYCSAVVIDTVINNPIGCNAYFIFTQTAPYNMVAVNLSSGNNISFSWDFGDGTPAVTGPYPSHQYASTGSYQICLTVADMLGCTDTYCDSITVDSSGNIIYRSVIAGFVLNVVAPDDITTGITEQLPLISSIYPVPSSDVIHVALSEYAKYYLIYNSEGQLVMEGLQGDKTDIDISKLSPGVYLLRVKNDVREGSRIFIRK
jgi:PKD repeat protein